MGTANWARFQLRLSLKSKSSPPSGCSAGYSLDLDSTVFERYGHQQGALRGPNPRKHGRPSHHPLVAVLAEAHFLLHGWLRSGNCGTARGVVEFLKEALALLIAKVVAAKYLEDMPPDNGRIYTLESTEFYKKKREAEAAVSAEDFINGRF
jgi:hypothetical protein